MRLGAKASLKRTKAESATTANPAFSFSFLILLSEFNAPLEVIEVLGLFRAKARRTELSTIVSAVVFSYSSGSSFHCQLSIVN